MVIVASICLCVIYFLVEFFDYITGVIAHIASGDYTSHNAKLGAIRKLLVALSTMGSVVVCLALVKCCNILGYAIPTEIAGVSGLYIVKAIITEFTSIQENIQTLKEGGKNDKE